jgi:hypothetical protein
MLSRSIRAAASLPLLALATSALMWPVHSRALAAVSEGAQSQQRAFDFLMGTWEVKNIFLAKRLQHSHQWLHFTAIDIERPLATGTGDIEIYKTGHWPQYVGMNVRLYNPATKQWTLYWTDNRFSRGIMQPPVVGSFHGSYGVFEGNDHLNGVPIIVRFTWRSIDHDHARWTQAFSSDQGKTWEVNWIMKFTRSANTN